MQNFTLHKYADVKSLFPSDSWVSWRNNINDGEFEDEWILVHHGDVTVDYLDLNEIEKRVPNLPEGDFIFCIVVDGNLSIESHTYNENTDGATCLVVRGDLKVPNAVVGGSEIYVTGNLEVSELFWGDYNHGTLKVKGNAAINVLLSTDYAIEIEGHLEANHNLDTEDCDIECDLAAALFDTSIYDRDEHEAEDDLSSALSREDMAKRLATGHSLLQRDYLKTNCVTITPAPVYGWDELCNTATIEEVRSILAMSCVKDQYTEYDSDYGIRKGRRLIMFRQARKDHGWERISISKNHPNDDDECDMFHYDIEYEDGVERLHIEYQSENDPELDFIRIDADAPAERISEACNRFKFMVDLLTKYEADYRKTMDEFAKEDAARQERLKVQKPYAKKTVKMCGITFKVLRQVDAAPWLEKLHWGVTNASYYVGPFGGLDENGYFLLAENNAVCDGHFDMEWDNHPEDLDVVGIIFAGNLTCTGNILSCDTDTGPYFAVLGDVTARTLALSGNTHVIMGNVKADLIYGKYNHGSLFVAGLADVQCVMVDDFRAHFGQLATYAAVDTTGFRLEFIIDAGEQVILPFAATHDQEEVLAASILSHEEDEGGYGGFYVPIINAVQAGEAIIDFDRITKTITECRVGLLDKVQQIFSHPHFKKDDVLFVDADESGRDYYQYFLHKSGRDTTYIVNYICRQQYYAYKVIATQTKPFIGKKRHSITLKNQYYDEDNDTERFSIESDLNDANYDAAKVLYCFRRAVKAFDEWTLEQ
jgi:hypothetical protein